MIISKANLIPVEVTGVDKNIPVLDSLCIEEDGSSCGGNGKSFLVVSPVPNEIREKVQAILPDEKSDGVIVTSQTTKEILKNIQRDTKFAGMLEHTAVKKVNNKVSFTIYDGARKRHIDGKINPMSYPPYRKMFSNAMKNTIGFQAVVNLKRLLPLLNALLKASGDSGDFCPMYMEVTKSGDILFRMTNPRTDQRCLALMWVYKGNEAKCLELNKWEEGLKDDENVNKSRSDINNSLTHHSSRNTYRVAHKYSDKSNHETQVKRCKAKKTGNQQRAYIVDEMCSCGEYHLASDGIARWCSGVDGCGFFERID